MSELERVPSAPDVVDLSQVLDILSERAGTDTTVEPKESRVAKRAQWATQLRWTESARKELQDASGRVGVLPLPEEARKLEAEERNALMDEALVIRDIQDKVQGRYEAIRGTVFATLDLDTPEQAGEVMAPRLGKKFVREMRGKPSVDWQALLDLLPTKLKNRIARVRTVTTVIRDLSGNEVSRGETHETFVDEAAALEAVKSGELSMDTLAQVIVPAKKTSYFTIRDMAPEDSLPV